MGNLTVNIQNLIKAANCGVKIEFFVVSIDVTPDVVEVLLRPKSFLAFYRVNYDQKLWQTLIQHYHVSFFQLPQTIRDYNQISSSYLNQLTGRIY